MKIPHISEVETVFGNERYPNLNEIRENYIKSNITQEEFKKMEKLFNEWFFMGLESIEVTPRDGIDKKEALKYIRSCMVSYLPGHEVKEEVCTKLLALCFKDATWKVE